MFEYLFINLNSYEVRSLERSIHWWNEVKRVMDVFEIFDDSNLFKILYSTNLIIL